MKFNLTSHLFLSKIAEAMSSTSTGGVVDVLHRLQNTILNDCYVDPVVEKRTLTEFHLFEKLPLELG